MKNKRRPGAAIPKGKFHEEEEAMPTKKAAYDMEYRRQNIKSMMFDLNKNTDADIIEYLETVGPRTTYIKSLIRADMERANFQPKSEQGRTD